MSFRVVCAATSAPSVTRKVLAISFTAGSGTILPSPGAMARYTLWYVELEIQGIGDARLQDRTPTGALTRDVLYGSNPGGGPPVVVSTIYDGLDLDADHRIDLVAPNPSYLTLVYSIG